MAHPVPPLQHIVLPRKQFLGQTGMAIGEIVNAAVRERGSALVGFTGSPSLESLYASLGLDEEVAWERVYFFAIDEAYVPQCPERSGYTRRILESVFHWPDPARMLCPTTERIGPVESARRFADRLEALQGVPDLVILTVELDGTTAGYRDPIDGRAFQSETVALALHHPGEWVPYTVAASIEFLRRSRIVLFVLPTEAQADVWLDRVIGGPAHPAEKLRASAAVSLLSHPAVRVVSVDE